MTSGSSGRSPPGALPKAGTENSIEGPHPSTQLTHKGYDTLSPVYSPDGKRIAYLVANGDEFPGIYLMNADGSNDHKLVENVFPVSAGENLAWSPDGARIYHTKAEIQRNTDFYNDIYYYDLNKQKEVRITDMLRARDPFPSPDGKRLVFVMNKMGRTRLATIEIPDERSLPVRALKVTFLTEESEIQYTAPRFSPEGAKIAVSVWQNGGYRDIWILDSQGRSSTRLLMTARSRAHLHGALTENISTSHLTDRRLQPLCL
jgi:Tol biopolymer transport system component